MKKPKSKPKSESKVLQVRWLRRTKGPGAVDFFACLLYIRIGKKEEYTIGILQEIVGCVDDISLLEKAKTKEPYFAV